VTACTIGRRHGSFDDLDTGRGQRANLRASLFGRLEVRGIGAARRDHARTFELARVDAPLELHDAGHRAATRHQSRESGVEELLHALDGLLAEPLVRVAVDDVAVRIDVARQHGSPTGIERRLTRGSRVASGDRDDAAVFDDDGATRDVRIDVEDASVRDDEILRERRASTCSQREAECRKSHVPPPRVFAVA
jgi:hypothetical protein